MKIDVQRGAVRDQIKSLADPGNAQFLANLIPTIGSDTILGARTPALRILAKQLATDNPEDVREFLTQLPHTYFDENLLHGLLINQEKSFHTTLALLEPFLDFVDNWAVCDQIKPRSFTKNRALLFPHILNWIDSGEQYRVRFGVLMLLTHFLDEDFTPEHLVLMENLDTSQYYVHMVVVWYVATALAKQPDVTLAWLEKNTLDSKTHNKAIQKAIESRRVTEENKLKLRGLKRQRE